MNRIAMSSLSVWMFCSIASTYVFAQCEDKSGFAKQACQVQANSTALAGQAGLDTKSAPLTTTFADTIHQGTLPPSMEPKSFRPLTALPRTDDGAFILGHAGIFEVYAQSYTLEVNDMKFAVAPGFGIADGWLQSMKDAFDTLYAEGARAPKMMSIGIHCRLAGRPSRAATLARFLDYVASKPKVWVATRKEIAQHWMKVHPAA